MLIHYKKNITQWLKLVEKLIFYVWIFPDLTLFNQIKNFPASNVIWNQQGFFHSITWIVPGRKLGSINGDRINGGISWVYNHYNPLILGNVYLSH